MSNRFTKMPGVSALKTPMPVETIINSGHPFAIQRVTDALTTQEVIEAQRELYLTPGYDPETPVLWEINTVRVEIGFTDILEMVEGSTELWSRMKGSKTAILVAEPQDAANARLYKELAEAMPRELEVFIHYDDAISWLTAGVSAPKAL